MVTVRDVARQAGVSAMTVSNVINGRQGRVSAATVERVRAVIEELGYVPNEQARSLAGASSRILAVVSQTAPGRSSLSSPYDALFVGACEREARSRGYVVMLCGGSDAAELKARLRGWRVDGAVVMATTTIRPSEFLEEAGVPCVFLDNYDVDFGGSSVNIADHEGARLAGMHLRELGHTSALVIGPERERSAVMRERYAGFCEGFAGEVSFLATDVSFDAGAEAGTRLAQALFSLSAQTSLPTVTAVFAAADILAIGLIHALKEAGVSVPGSVSVVGFDGIEAGGYLDPVLTTVEQPVDDKAVRAVEELLQQLAGSQVSQKVTLPVHLRVGGSCALPRVDD